MDPSPAQGPPKPKSPPFTLTQRPSQGEIATGGGAKGDVPPAKPARPSGRVVVETLSVQKKKEKEEKGGGGFFANLKKKFKTTSDDATHPAVATPPPKGPPPPPGLVQASAGLAARPPQGTKVQAETEKLSLKRGSTEQAKGAGIGGSPDAGELPDAEGNVFPYLVPPPPLTHTHPRPYRSCVCVDVMLWVDLVPVVTERDPEQEERERREFLLSIGYSEDIELDDLPKEVCM